MTELLPPMARKVQRNTTGSGGYKVDTSKFKSFQGNRKGSVYNTSHKPSDKGIKIVDVGDTFKTKKMNSNFNSSSISNNNSTTTTNSNISNSITTTTPTTSSNIDSIPDGWKNHHHQRNLAAAESAGTSPSVTVNNNNNNQQQQPHQQQKLNRLQMNQQKQQQPHQQQQRQFSVLKPLLKSNPTHDPDIEILEEKINSTRKSVLKRPGQLSPVIPYRATNIDLYKQSLLEKEPGYKPNVIPKPIHFKVESGVGKFTLLHGNKTCGVFMPTALQINEGVITDVRSTPANVVRTTNYQSHHERGPVKRNKVETFSLPIEVLGPEFKRRLDAAKAAPPEVVTPQRKSVVPAIVSTPPPPPMQKIDLLSLAMESSGR